MSKITRATQSEFGTSAGSDTFTEFGALAASYPSVPTFYTGSTITPALVQGLSAFSGGWTAAVVDNNAPCFQDMNALFFLAFYQLSYLMQEGVPEWDSGTTYYIGSIAQDGNGNLYKSLSNTNLNNALSTSSWQKVGGAAIVQTKTTSYSILTSDNLIRMNSASATTATLPDATTCIGSTYVIKNINTGTVSIATTSSQTIDGQSSYSLPNQYQFVRVQSNGTNWDIVG